MDVRFNATKMFAHREPWDCSNSIANLGERAGALTWGCAMEVASAHERWLLSDLDATIDAIREDAAGYGAWDREEIAAWSDLDCLALFVQFVAGDLRELGSDDKELHELEDGGSTYLYSVEAEGVLGERYLGT